MISSEEDFKVQVTQPESTHCLICGNCHPDANCTANVVTFFWTKPAKEVSVVGEWSNWKKREPMVSMNEYFECAISLGLGTYEYKFVVDGEQTHDDTQPVSTADNGSYNNVLEVLPKRAYVDQYHCDEGEDNRVNITINSAIQTEGLKILGSWDNWKVEKPLFKEMDPLKNRRINSVQLSLEKGNRYEFKFKDNKGQQFIDETYPSTRNEQGQLNNYIITSSFEEIQTPKCVLESLVKTNSVVDTRWVWDTQVHEDLHAYDLYGHSMNVVGENLYVFGGVFKKKFRDDMYRVSLQDLSDIEMMKTPQHLKPRAFHSSVSDGNKIIIFGGINTSVLDDCLVYNTASDEWNQPDTLEGKGPSKREKSTSVLYKDSVIVYGGYFCCPKTGQEVVYNDIYVLDTQSMTWKKPSTGCKDDPARFAHSAAIYGDEMLMFGGLLSTEPCVNSNELWKLQIEKDHLEWALAKTNGTAPAPRHGHTASIILHYMVIFGGACESGMFNDVTMLDLNNMQWIVPTIQGDVPRPVSYHAAVVSGNELLVMGGKTEAGKDVAKIHILKPKATRRRSFCIGSTTNSSFSNCDDSSFY